MALPTVTNAARLSSQWADCIHPRRSVRSLQRNARESRNQSDGKMRRNRRPGNRTRFFTILLFRIPGLCYLCVLSSPVGWSSRVVTQENSEGVRVYFNNVEIEFVGLSAADLNSIMLN